MPSEKQGEVDRKERRQIKYWYTKIIMCWYFIFLWAVVYSITVRVCFFYVENIAESDIDGITKKAPYFQIINRNWKEKNNGCQFKGEKLPYTDGFNSK
jgi:hypothetical protein